MLTASFRTHFRQASALMADTLVSTYSYCSSVVQSLQTVPVPGAPKAKTPSPIGGRREKPTVCSTHHALCGCQVACSSPARDRRGGCYLLIFPVPTLSGYGRQMLPAVILSYRIHTGCAARMQRISGEQDDKLWLQNQAGRTNTLHTSRRRHGGLPVQ